MPPAKRSLPKEKEVINKVTHGMCYCSKCQNKGKEIYENIFLCNAGVNKGFGNQSVLNCIKYKS